MESGASQLAETVRKALVHGGVRKVSTFRYDPQDGLDPIKKARTLIRWLCKADAGIDATTALQKWNACSEDPAAVLLILELSCAGEDSSKATLF